MRRRPIARSVPLIAAQTSGQVLSRSMRAISRRGLRWNDARNSGGHRYGNNAAAPAGEIAALQDRLGFPRHKNSTFDRAAEHMAELHRILVRQCSRLQQPGQLRPAESAHTSASSPPISMVKRGTGKGGSCEPAFAPALDSFNENLRRRLAGLRKLGG